MLFALCRDEIVDGFEVGRIDRDVFVIIDGGAFRSRAGNKAGAVALRCRFAAVAEKVVARKPVFPAPRCGIQLYRPCAARKRAVSHEHSLAHSINLRIDGVGVVIVRRPTVVRIQKDGVECIRPRNGICLAEEDDGMPLPEVCRPTAVQPILAVGALYHVGRPERPRRRSLILPAARGAPVGILADDVIHFLQAAVFIRLVPFCGIRRARAAVLDGKAYPIPMDEVGAFSYLIAVSAVVIGRKDVIGAVVFDDGGIVRLCLAPLRFIGGSETRERIEVRIGRETRVVFAVIRTRGEREGQKHDERHNKRQ